MTTIPGLIALIYIGSPTVSEDVVSLSTSGLYASYFIPCSLLLWRRTTGLIESNFANTNDHDDFLPNLTNLSTFERAEIQVVQPHLKWGPWRLPGLFGIVSSLYTCVYILFVLFWSFWPPSTPATPSTVNHSILMTGAVIMFSNVYYYVWGRKQYLGPLLEREAGELLHKKP